MPEECNDRRVKRTKKLLREGLVQLMQTKPVKDISVKELSDLVDINRGTFYLYYRDIFDMVQHLEDELFDAIETIIVQYTDTSAQGTITDFFTALFSYVKENSRLFRLLLGPTGDSQFLQRFSVIVRNTYSKDLHLTDGDVPDTEFYLKYSFAVFGIIGLVHYWLEQGCIDPIDTLSATAAQMTAGILFQKLSCPKI